MSNFETTITNPELAGANVQAPDAGPAEARPIPEAKPADKHGWWWGTGRRKTAVARVRLRPAKDGQGKLQMQITNKKFKSIDDYFSEMRDRSDAQAPLVLTDTAGKLDVFVRAHGGGYMGQAQAIRLGIARALVGYDPTFEAALRDAGYLTRDARKVERKKYGQPGARRRFQFSKR
ncbi:MAG: 30S ribosomal protein S9 [Phycisphaeraceae bacterium]|nr:MAG: 30S ribosomal protein S9 [Phycisphaeraceae bacterium]